MKEGKRGGTPQSSIPAAAAGAVTVADVCVCVGVCVGGEETSSLSSGSLTAAQIQQSRDRVVSPHPVVFAVYLS